jgi:hypothetical protein
MADYRNRDYTIRGGKDAAITNNRQRMGKEQYDQKQTMVKQEQAKVEKYNGDFPVMEDRFYRFNACMMNNGAHAQMLAKQLTGNIDDVAYPVRQSVDMSQD